MAYRLLTLLFSYGWFIAHLVRSYHSGLLNEFLLYITHWFETTYNVYLPIAFVIAMKGKNEMTVAPSKYSQDDIFSLKDSQSNNCKIISAKRIDTSDTCFNIAISEDASDGQYKSIRHERLGWYHKLCWYLYELSLVGSVLVSISYWVFLYPRNGATFSISPFDIYQHGLTAILLLIDLLLLRIPIKIGHAVYHCAFGSLYMMLSLFISLIRHSQGRQEYAVYWLLDWISDPTWPILISFCLFPVMVFLQSLCYLLNEIKTDIYEKYF